MTYAPADLLTVQRYAREKTGQDWVSLGIVGDQSHNSEGGYHVGHDVLHALGTAPEDPGSDYSYTESQRDRRGLTDAASAFDLGGDFPRFHEFSNWLVGKCRAGDPRCRDIREVIYTPDGSVVRRWDALGIRSTGDPSHRSHTHFSFFRDSLGRRASDDNFLGLLREFFDGKPTPEVPDVNADQDRKLTNVDQYLYAMASGALIIGYIKFADGTVRELPNVPMQKLAALEAKVGQLEVGGVDLDALAAKVTALLPKPPTAAEVADEIDRRERTRLGNG